MKINSSLFEVKERMEVKSESLVDNLYSIYEQNFKLIVQVIFNSSLKQTSFKYIEESPINLILSSNYHVPDIQMEMNYLSAFTVDVEMYYKDNKLENIRYFYYVKFRLFLDAKILEVKETGFLRSNCGKIQESEKEEANKSINPESVQCKLTKSLLVHEWLNKVVMLKYELSKAL